MGKTPHQKLVKGYDEKKKLYKKCHSALGCGYEPYREGILITSQKQANRCRIMASAIPGQMDHKQLFS